MTDLPADVLAALDAFYLAHRTCGELSGDVDNDGLRRTAWLVCSGCGASIRRDVGDDRE